MATASKDKRYIETVGRRKTAIARVRITEAAHASIVINEKPLANYFGSSHLQNIATESLKKGGADKAFTVSVKVKGGGATGQAEAIRHGIARALIEYNIDLRKGLKKLGFLKRDPRAKERRKFGLKKARKAPQWSKR